MRRRGLLLAAGVGGLLLASALLAWLPTPGPEVDPDTGLAIPEFHPPPNLLQRLLNYLRGRFPW